MATRERAYRYFFGFVRGGSNNGARLRLGDLEPGAISPTVGLAGALDVAERFGAELVRREVLGAGEVSRPQFIPGIKRFRFELFAGDCSGGDGEPLSLGRV